MSNSDRDVKGNGVVAFFFSSSTGHTRRDLGNGIQTCALAVGEYRYY